MINFSTRLEKERQKKNLTQRGLALELGWSVSEVAFLELGDKKPDLETLNTLADYFNVSVDYLIGRCDKPKNANQKIKEVLAKDPALHGFWEEISKREDLQLLFKQTRDLSPKSIYRVIEIIKTIEEEEREQYGG
ncbi:helix-turn-helix domain-containing protein [Halonatronum saccharophilum]|uniref:helix-turn-helix domain-containing protein n=1 Tax=Halonatronum saccharophilum TaxID=150060 RepID=UPI0004AF16CA|nr:helix-turn-helix domain-containing protein [Halonatronum saccharophilum]